MGATCTQAEESKGPLRWHPFPEPPESGQTDYGRRNPELGRLEEAEQANIFLSSQAWAVLAKPVLDGLDRERDRRGRKLEWTAEDKEKILVYGVICGYEAHQIKHTLKALRGDRIARTLLGFTRPREGRPGEPTSIDAFLPSADTMRAHLRKLGMERRAQMYEAVELCLLDDYLAIPGVLDEALSQLYLDGSDVKTHHTPPIYRRRKRGKGRNVLVNEKNITAPDAGYRADSKRKKGGPGWQYGALMTSKGICLSRKRGRITEEVKLVDAVIDEFAERFTPRMPEDRFGVLTMDGLHNRPTARFASRVAGLVENVHFVSHSKASKPRAQAHRNKRYPIVHPSKPAYKNWFADGHRQLHCRCGKGRTECQAKRRKGKIVLAVIGRCKSCGNVRVQSGRWRFARNPDHFRLCQPGEYDQADLALGNPLTFDDPRAAVYGEDRFGHQEGVFGTLRNKGLEEKTWFRYGAQVDASLAIRFGVMNALSIEKHRRASRAGPAPPALAAA